MNTSPETGELAAALAKAQRSLRNAPKDAVNPHFRSSYASLASILDTIREPLTANGLAQGQTAQPGENGRIVMVTRLMHGASDQWIEGTVEAMPKDASPQAVGSCITYLRRYGLAALIGIAAGDDDDGNASQGGQGNQSRPKPKPKPEPEPNPHRRSHHNPSWAGDKRAFSKWACQMCHGADAINDADLEDAAYRDLAEWILSAEVSTKKPSAWISADRAALQQDMKAGDMREQFLAWFSMRQAKRQRRAKKRVG